VQKESFLSFYLAFVLLLALAIPVFAEEGPRFSHSARYDIDGIMDITKEFGDPCTTGAFKRQTIRGQGKFTKSEDVQIARHIMSFEDEMEWSTADDAVSNLQVTSRIELCARPMSAAADDYAAEYVYDNDYELIREGYDIRQGDIISPYHPLVVEGLLGVSPLTRQVWATAVSSEPGHEGAYKADLIAAYGPGPHDEEAYGKDFRWWFDDDDMGSISHGDRYVGNYFEIDQYVFTSSGETRRFLSISSPFSNAYIEEDLSVTGMAEITDDFKMDNLEPGIDAITLAWHDLF